MHDCLGALEIFVDGGWHWVVRTDSAFPGRGLPADASCDFSELVQRLERNRAVSSMSWASLNELRAIDWDESALDVDSRVSKYSVAQEGRERLVSKAFVYPELDAGLLPGPGADFQVGVGSFVYRRRRLRRRELLEDSDFGVLMGVADALAVAYGEDCVRWIVVFAL